MQTALMILGILTAAIFVRTGIDITLGKRRVAQLRDIESILPGLAPPVSVVIPACNEEAKIEAALSSVLAQHYPALEVIAVDDRSSDGTGRILDRMAQSSERLRVVHIKNLPPDWLGKNHALHAGAAQAAGQWLLFADADVVMEKSAISRAIRYAVERNLDHLAVTPRAVVGGFLANVFLAGFALLFSMHTRPWRVRDPKAKEFIGIGAFNLVRADAYRAVGGHAPIAMRPDDDMKLGKLLKTSGFRSDVAFGADLLCVDWYGSFSEMRRGLMKNLFSALNYSVSFAALACAVVLVLFVWPVAAVVATRGAVRWLNAAACAAAFLAFARNSSIVKMGWWWCFTLPLAGLITIYLIARAVATNLLDGGIEWRGTRYPLRQLRANRF